MNGIPPPAIPGTGTFSVSTVVYICQSRFLCVKALATSALEYRSVNR